MGILNTVTAPFKDIGKSFSYGFDMPGNIKDDGIKGLFSGFRPHIGGAMIGGIAAGYAGTKIEDVDAGQAALVGAGVGAAALPALGLAGAGAYAAGRGILNNSDKIVNGALATGRYAGKAAVKGVLGPQFKGTTKAGKNWAEAGNRLFNPVARYSTMLNRAAGNFVDIQPKKKVYNPNKQKMVTEGGVKLKALGWGVIGLGAIMGAGNTAMSAMDQSRIGRRDMHVTTATPQVASYANNAGASGDLVFALNANRRG